uniref:Uncharacterized protein n=1 Tax=Anopheles christyi TaxID=43041 RepID=A0A182KHZ3_9DIPT
MILLRTGPTFLGRNHTVSGVNAIEITQILLIHKCHRFVQIKATIAENARVARMVIFLMEIHQILMLQRRNVQWITARNVPVRMVGKQLVKELLPKHGRVFRKRTLHLVVHDTLEQEVRFRVV